MTELVIPVPNAIVVPIPVDILLGMAVGYYLIGFAVVLRHFRVHDDDSLIRDLQFAAVGGVVWLPLVVYDLDELEEQRAESDSAEDDTETSERGDSGE